MTMDSTKNRAAFCRGKSLCLGLCVLLYAFPCRSQQSPIIESAGTSTPGQQTNPQPSGSIRGQIVDQSGTAIPAALIKLSGEGQFPGAETLSDDDGRFSFSNVAPGPFQLIISSPGFASQNFSGTLQPEEAYVAPLMTLALATQSTEVRVELTPIELADVQIKEQEKQRVLGVIPNFYVTYIPNAAPLTPKHKFELAWKSSIDPVSFLIVGAVAGFAQAGNRWGSYGQGAQGYGKRYATSYADMFVGTFIGSAVLPSLLKQDPRYYYQGGPSKRSRIRHALASAVICKGDNGHWQPNYSGILGSLAAGGISNLYYPSDDRSGAGDVFGTALIGIAETAASNLFQEFLIPKLTPNLPTRASAQP